MKVPETYEEFLKTPKEDLLKISKILMSPNEAKMLISFLDKFESEHKLHITNESKDIRKNTLWEELYG